MAHLMTPQEAADLLQMDNLRRHMYPTDKHKELIVVEELDHG